MANRQVRVVDISLDDLEVRATFFLPKALDDLTLLQPCFRSCWLFASSDTSFRAVCRRQAHSGEDLVREVKLNTKRYVTLISQAIDEALPEPNQQVRISSSSSCPGVKLLLLYGSAILQGSLTHALDL